MESFFNYIIENKLKSILLILLPLLITISALSGFYYQQVRNDKANNDIFQAVYYFETEAYQEALQGDGIYPSFLTIIKEHPFTQAADLAHFYAGVCYIKTQQYDNAIELLQKFTKKGSNWLLKARAWSLIGDAFSEKEAYRQAAENYMKAANCHPNKIFTPIYLAKAALNFELVEAYESALICYKKIKTEYRQSQQYIDAIKHMDRLGILYGEGDVAE
jgi:tetratricopeptide (TPR) repeat protein